jgi:3-methylornithyl-N6-L-lysine dehydrogenase
MGRHINKSKMTRLIESDIKDITGNLKQLDWKLRFRTGKSLRGVACHALGVQEKSILETIGRVTIAVVPIRCGEGIISGFSQVVAGIVSHIGFKVFVTQSSNVSGLAEAIEHKADVVMMADDDRFIALDILNKRIIDNTPATAKGFVAGLDLICSRKKRGQARKKGIRFLGHPLKIKGQAGIKIRGQARKKGIGLRGHPLIGRIRGIRGQAGIEDQSVLVLGCGPLGRCVAVEAVKRGANVSLFDKDETISREALKEIQKEFFKDIPLNVHPSLSSALSAHRLVIDATNASDIIDETDINQNTYISAPGMPLGLTAAAVKGISARLYHDPLQTGVAVMAIEAALLKDNG